MIFHQQSVVSAGFRGSEKAICGAPAYKSERMTEDSICVSTSEIIPGVISEFSGPARKTAEESRERRLRLGRICACHTTTPVRRAPCAVRRAPSAVGGWVQAHCYEGVRLGRWEGARAHGLDRYTAGKTLGSHTKSREVTRSRGRERFRQRFRQQTQSRPFVPLRP